MSIKIHEDSRTFREFYPEFELRQKVHYFFAHRFLPQYVYQNPYAFFAYNYLDDPPGSVMEPTRFIQSRWSSIFEQKAGLTPPVGIPFEGNMVFRRVTDLSMSLARVGERPCAVVQMPMPERSPQAFYVCPVLLVPPGEPKSWPRDAQARVFTLEASQDIEPALASTGVFCEWKKDGSHANFGMAVPLNPEDLLKAIAMILEKNVQSRYGFIPGKDGKDGTVTVDGKPVSRPPLLD